VNGSCVRTCQKCNEHQPLTEYRLNKKWRGRGDEEGATRERVCKDCRREEARVRNRSPSPRDMPPLPGVPTTDPRHIAAMEVVVDRLDAGSGDSAPIKALDYLWDDGRKLLWHKCAVWAMWVHKHGDNICLEGLTDE